MAFIDTPNDGFHSQHFTVGTLGTYKQWSSCHVTHRPTPSCFTVYRYSYILYSNLIMDLQLWPGCNPVVDES